jgi:hypothetical protein
VSKMREVAGGTDGAGVVMLPRGQLVAPRFSASVVPPPPASRALPLRCAAFRVGCADGPAGHP